MAKTPKLKANPAHANPRSRASKRASSPSLNLDKSLKSLPRHEDANNIANSSSLLHHHHATIAGGITKPSKRTTSKKTTKSRNQRLRQEKGLARAEIVMEKLEKRVEGSQGKVEKIKGRKAGWEEVNGLSRKAKARALAAMVVREEGEEGDGWVDEEDDGAGAAGDDAEMIGVDGLPKAVEEKLVVADRPTTVNGVEEEDNIT